MHNSSSITAILLAAVSSVAIAQDAAPNTWVKLENAVIEGNRWDIPLA